MAGADDKNWEMIQAALAAEASGKNPRVFSSRRTLFGIPSSLDEELAKLDAQPLVPEGGGPAKGAPVKGVPAKGAPAKRAAVPTRVAHPLPPVFSESSRVLILGTMPSPKSRETGFYYNHPQNRFWPVMAALFSAPVPQTNEEKEQLVRDHGIALWDVLAECSIEGAADGTIADIVPNDIARILGQAPIKAVFCTGAKATELYRRHCEAATGMPCMRLSSTSPANAGTSLGQLIEEYRQILPFCS